MLAVSYCIVNINFRLTVPEVNTTSELEALQPHQSALFLIVHHGEVDQDWHRLYVRQAKEKGLKAKLAYTTKKEISEVRLTRASYRSVWLEGAH